MATHRSLGFTLIELMVVVGVIALVAGSLVIGLRGGDGTKLRSAQSTVSSMISAARSRAAIENRQVALMISASPGDADAYLRRLALAENMGGSWELVDQPVFLPTGVYIVPPVPPAGSVPMAPAVSALDGNHSHDGAAQLAAVFTATGRLTTSVSIVLAVGTAQPPEEGSPVVFLDAENVRGVVVSAYGAVTFIDDKNGF